MNYPKLAVNWLKREYCHEVNDDELRKDVHEKCYAKAYAVATSGTDKHQRAEAFEAVVEEYKAQFSEEELTDEKVEMNRPLLPRCRKRSDAPRYPGRREASGWS